MLHRNPAGICNARPVNSEEDGDLVVRQQSGRIGEGVQGPETAGWHSRRSRLSAGRWAHPNVLT